MTNKHSVYAREGNMSTEDKLALCESVGVGKKYQLDLCHPHQPPVHCEPNRRESQCHWRSKKKLCAATVTICMWSFTFTLFSPTRESEGISYKISTSHAICVTTVQYVSSYPRPLLDQPLATFTGEIGTPLITQVSTQYWEIEVTTHYYNSNTSFLMCTLSLLYITPSVLSREEDLRLLIEKMLRFTTINNYWELRKEMHSVWVKFLAK